MVRAVTLLINLALKLSVLGVISRFQTKDYPTAESTIGAIWSYEGGIVMSRGRAYAQPVSATAIAALFVLIAVAKPPAATYPAPVSVTRPKVPPAASLDRSPDANASVASDKIRQRYARQPLAFEPNSGQAGKPIKYLARGLGYTLFLTPSAAQLLLHRDPPAPPSR